MDVLFHERMTRSRHSVIDVEHKREDRASLKLRVRAIHRLHGEENSPCGGQQAAVLRYRSKDSIELYGGNVL